MTVLHACAALPLATILVVVAAGDAGAERLATRRYTTAEGLAGDYVVSAFRDARGFLWFATRDGLSRFDGTRFVTYGVADGLPRVTVNAVLETREGVYWVATNGGGICRFDPEGRSRPAAASGATAEVPASFTCRLPGEGADNRVNEVFEDRHGDLWLGTDSGLFRLDGGDPSGTMEPVPLRLPSDPSLNGVHAIAEDDEGDLWIGGGFGLRRRLPDGRVVEYRAGESGPVPGVNALAFDGRGTLWVGMRDGLVTWRPAPAGADAAAPESTTRGLVRIRAGATPRGASDRRRGDAVARWFTGAEGLPDDNVTSVFPMPDGEVWIGTARGPGRLSGERVRALGDREGLSPDTVTGIVSDVAGNLWIASVSGVTRLIRFGLTTFDGRDGLVEPRVYALRENAAGRVIALTDDYHLNEFDGTAFHAVRPGIPAGSACHWLSPCGYLDRTDHWWLLTTGDFYRMPAVTDLRLLDGRPPAETVTRGPGAPERGAFSAFEDSTGRFWVGSAGGALASRDPATGEWRRYSEADGLPPLARQFSRVIAFAEDREGRVWLGFDESGLARWRDGRFDVFDGRDGVPPGSITALHVDRAGRLWIGTNQAGLSRIDDPLAARPRIDPVIWAGAERSRNVRCLVDDDRGRLYIGTSRGIDRLDPATGQVRHFSVGEGLAAEFVTAALRDRSGALWFGTISGLSRLDPSAERPAPSPALPVYLDRVRVGGVARPLSALGEQAPEAFTVSPGLGQVEIDYFALVFDASAGVRYQYRLGGDAASWSAPTDSRSVTYASLSPGAYRFDVRAVRSDGTPAEGAARLRFRVLPPLYLRWWFVGLAVSLAAGLAVAGYRLRVRQLLRVERVRARIATDLHDDIGASLSQIAILAEVARARPATGADAGPGPGLPGDPLDRIAETSRESVDAMSDIVWAINPEVDTLGDLVHRMRRFVEDTLGSGDADVVFDAPSPLPELVLGADVRREVLLILKEGVTNVARHAAATRVHVALEADRRGLRLTIADNGRGFDPTRGADGNGLLSMRRRVAALGGRFTVDSTPGLGTTLRLEVVLKGHLDEGTSDAR